jgi:DNA adenine methylase
MSANVRTKFQNESDSQVFADRPNTTSVKPPLKWAGGKRWLLPHLEPRWRSFRDRVYVEPFCGGLAAALGLRPERAVLNDINPHLINFYRHIQNGLEIALRMEYDETLFYSHRERFNKLIATGQSTSAEAAELFYYLNRSCFNGLCRFNQRGEFNVPFGTYKSVRYQRDFTSLRSTLRDWKFTNEDLEHVDAAEGSFIYADPPYDVEFRSYSAGGFSWEDQERTANWLAQHKGPVVLSNQATPRIVKLYKQSGFELVYLEGPRRISCTGDRTAAKEVLALKLNS